MSIIATKKAQQKKGPETILIYMGGTFLLAVLGILLVYVISHYGLKNDWLSLDEMLFTPIIYFLTLGGLGLGMGSYLRENPEDLSRFTDWVIGFCLLGILVGAALGAYMW